MPLIRYRTGDLARFIPEPCSCGSMLRRMGQVKGRVAGTCQVAEGTLTLRELDEALFSVDGLLNFEVSLSRSNHRDRLTIGLKMANEVNGSVKEVIRAALDTVPTIQSAFRQGSLEICLEILPGVGALKSTTTKRFIKHL